MARRINEGAARSRRREAQRVVDDSALRLVPAGQSREDRQACRVGRRPGRGADAVRAQAPSRACPGVPAASGVREPAELVEPARVPVEEQSRPRVERRNLPAFILGPCEPWKLWERGRRS